MPRAYFRPVTDAHVVSILHYVRSVLVRDEREGVEHVDALLRAWGTDPDTLPIPLKRPKHFKRSGLRRAILATLLSGPLTGAELAAKVGDGLEPKAAYKRTYAALHKMQAAGLVRRQERLWGLLSVPSACLKRAPSRHREA